MTNKIIENRFDPRKTKIIIIHDGRFHADDMMFAALAMSAAEKHKNKIEVKRLSNIPNEYDETIVVGDIGLGVYDHHIDKDNVESIGIQGKDETELRAACGLLYRDIKDTLFPGDSETKKVFEAFIDIIEHCDNTPDSNTFSDAINLFTPVDESKMDEMAEVAISFCKSIVYGFMEAHEKEKSGKIWAVPRVCSHVVPGVESKKDERYFKVTNQTKNKYKYISFDGREFIKLRSMDTYSLACGALNQRQRQYWRTIMEENDQAQIEDMERREKEEWPKVLAAMEHLTLCIDKFFPYGKFAKEIRALFVVTPSQRGGYAVNLLRTSTGKYRFDPDLLSQCEGCIFVANDSRFVCFDTKEHALAAAHTAGKAVELYFEKSGFPAYRDVYGGCLKEYSDNFFQDMICEDIAFCMYVREKIKNINQLSVDEYRMLQIAAQDNPYLIHSFCAHFKNNGENMQWDMDINVTDMKGVSNKTLWKKDRNNRRWNMGLEEFLKTPKGMEMKKKVFPQSE